MGVTGRKGRQREGREKQNRSKYVLYGCKKMTKNMHNLNLKAQNITALHAPTLPVILHLFSAHTL